MLHLLFELKAHLFGYLNTQSCATVRAWLLVDDADLKVFFSSLRDMAHNFLYYPISQLRLWQQDHWQKWKGLRRSGAAVSKNPRIKDAPRSFLKLSTCPHSLLGKAGVTTHSVFEESVLFPHTLHLLGSQHSRPRDRTGWDNTLLDKVSEHPVYVTPSLSEAKKCFMLLQIYLKSKHYTATVCNFYQGSTDVHQELVCIITNAQQALLSKTKITEVRK